MSASSWTNMPIDPMQRSQKALLLLLGSALSCVLISITFGALGALYYIPGVASKMAESGVSLVQLRPLHTTFASSWIFLGAVACCFAYIYHQYGEPSEAEWKRFKLQMVCWGLAGLGILFTLPFGVTTGREYLGFHPAFSLLIAAGWILFAWTFIGKVRHGFWGAPVHVYMWTVGVLYFLWTFAEGHFYLLPFVGDHPVADLQIQWKSCGTLVAAFNQMVYGGLFYIAERKTGDKRIAQSSTAFALFGVGLLNSFTNYAHHTYHLPQDPMIKWISFLVSMLEIILLVRVFQEVTAALRKRRRLYEQEPGVTDTLFTLSKRWNMCLLFLAICISVPPMNALIHGTHVVMAHAMGSELAIDSFLLLGMFAYLLAQIFPKREVTEDVIDSPAVRRAVKTMNLSLVALVIILLVSGFSTGLSRFYGQASPTWLEYFPFAFALFGCGLAYSLLRLLLAWAPLFLRPLEHRRWREQPVSTTRMTTQ